MRTQKKGRERANAWAAMACRQQWALGPRLPPCRMKTGPAPEEVGVSWARGTGKDRPQPSFSSSCLSQMPFYPLTAGLEHSYPSVEHRTILNNPLPPSLLQRIRKCLPRTRKNARYLEDMFLSVWRVLSCGTSARTILQTRPAPRWFNYEGVIDLRGLYSNYYCSGRS